MIALFYFDMGAVFHDKFHVRSAQISSEDMIVYMVFARFNVCCPGHMLSWTYARFSLNICCPGLLKSPAGLRIRCKSCDITICTHSAKKCGPRYADMMTYDELPARSLYDCFNVEHRFSLNGVSISPDQTLADAGIQNGARGDRWQRTRVAV